MITKPNNYDELKNSYETISVGGHMCVIKEAKEETDNNGRDILVVYFDTSAEDGQPQFFQGQFMKDKRTDKKWSYSGQRTFWKGSNWYEKNLSQMAGAIEESNPDEEIWTFSKEAGGLVLDLGKLNGMRIGVVFGEEEYIKNGETKTSVKPRYFCNYYEAPVQAIPKKKEARQRLDAPANFGFVQVADNLPDEGLPFR